jgi:rRNA maturation endonuclease Nob1
MSKEQVIDFMCNDCYGEFKLKYNQDDDDYTLQDVKFCPFCGNDLIRELELDEGSIGDIDEDLTDWDDE